MNDSYPVPEPVDDVLRASRDADPRACSDAINCEQPDISTLALLLSPAAAPLLEQMAVKASALTRRRFGRTIQLYAPLYISDFCSSECVYCGFASSRARPRRLLNNDEMLSEMRALKKMGFEEILLLTGERTPESDFEYLRNAVSEAAKHFHLVSIESFPMSRDEYRSLAKLGCTGITVYQETYDPEVYSIMHLRGPKSNYLDRFDTPARALSGGMRFAGMGILLGLTDPVADALRLFSHIEKLKKTFWKSGFSVSFPRIRPQPGGFVPPRQVDDSFLARMICAFRICLPDAHLVLSTRESARFRDGMAGVGISKMSVASRTTVGGYHGESAPDHGQFSVSDKRDAKTFCNALEKKRLEPVFKDWDSVFRISHDA